MWASTQNHTPFMLSVAVPERLKECRGRFLSHRFVCHDIHTYQTHWLRCQNHIIPMMRDVEVQIWKWRTFDVVGLNTKTIESQLKSIWPTLTRSQEIVFLLFLEFGDHCNIQYI